MNVTSNSSGILVEFPKEDHGFQTSIRKPFNIVEKSIEEIKKIKPSK